MPSFKGQQYTWLSLVSLLSLLILSFYLAKGDSPQDGKPRDFLPLRTRQSVSNTEDTTVNVFPPAARNAAVSLAGPPKGLARRPANDPYTCGPDRPCSNKACCGPSGNCGYTPAYCGAGCVSNCDAKAECGQYAAKLGQTCPLNACCSEHGFCGTTEVRGPKSVASGTPNIG
jgi:chitinase